MNQEYAEEYIKEACEQMMKCFNIRKPQEDEVDTIYDLKSKLYNLDEHDFSIVEFSRSLNYNPTQSISKEFNKWKSLREEYEEGYHLLILVADKTEICIETLIEAGTPMVKREYNPKSKRFEDKALNNEDVGNQTLLFVDHPIVIGPDYSVNCAELAIRCLDHLEEFIDGYKVTNRLCLLIQFESLTNTGKGNFRSFKKNMKNTIEWIRAFISGRNDIFSEREAFKIDHRTVDHLLCENYVLTEKKR